MKAIYTFNENDFLEINELIKITSSIHTLYQKLANLEIENKDKTSEYKEFLSYLNIALEVEDRFYKKAKLTYLKCQSWINFLNNDKVPYDAPNNMECIVLGDSKNRIIRRILTRLHDSQYLEYTEEKNYLESLGIGNLQSFFKPQIIKQKLFENWSYEELYSYYLFFLDEILKEYDEFKNQIILSKYNTSFILQVIEKRMLEYHFQSLYPEILNEKLDNQDLFIYQQIKNLIGKEFFSPQIQKLLLLEDEYYKEESVLFISLCRQSIIRSILLLMDTENYLSSCEDFHKYKQTAEYRTLYPRSSIR